MNEVKEYYKILENPKWSNPEYIPPDEITIYVLSKSNENQIFRNMFYDFYNYHHGLMNRKPRLEDYIKGLQNETTN